MASDWWLVISNYRNWQRQRQKQIPFGDDNQSGTFEDSVDGLLPMDMTSVQMNPVRGLQRS